MISIPVTATYVGLNALIILFLSYRVVQTRAQTKIGFGDGENTKLQQAIRVQSNTVEYVPIALLLILVLELMGGWSVALNILGSALTLARLAHAFGLSRSTETSAGRLVGTLVTWIVILVGGIWCLLIGVGIV
jgi:uncharacterized protein